MLHVCTVQLDTTFHTSWYLDVFAFSTVPGALTPRPPTQTTACTAWALILINSKYFFGTSRNEKTTGNDVKRNSIVQT